MLPKIIKPQIKTFKAGVETLSLNDNPCDIPRDLEPWVKSDSICI